MAYNDFRSYLDIQPGAQNVVATASGQVVTVANASYIQSGTEPTFVCSLAGCVTATPSNPPATVKYAILNGTTTIGSITIPQVVGSSANTTFTPPVAIAGGAVLTLSIVSTGTASATETAGASNICIGIAPQFV